MLEPSAQMLASCRQRVEALGASERTCWFDKPLEQGSALAGQRFDAVICHHVLHLLPPEEQDELLRQLAATVAAAGLEPPLQLFQALFSRMWISRRPA